MQLLETLLGSRNRIRVLRKLCGSKDWDFGVAELAGDSGLNKGAVSRVIDKLEKDGIVKTIRKGKVKLCRINRENVVVKTLVMPIFEKEFEMADSILASILARLRPRRHRSILSVTAYGSIVKGQFKLTSDVDLMLLLSDGSEIENIKRKLRQMSEEFSKDDIVLFFDILTADEFKKLYRQGEPSIRDIVSFNKVLYGRDLLEFT